MSTWQVQTAKQRLSEVLRAAESGEPQFITRHGEPIAVIIDIADYRATHEVRRPLVDYLLGGPKFDELDELTPRRRVDPDRAIGLFEG